MVYYNATVKNKFCFSDVICCVSSIWFDLNCCEDFTTISVSIASEYGFFVKIHTPFLLKLFPLYKFSVNRNIFETHNNLIVRKLTVINMKTGRNYLKYKK